ncbi:hypothetical protein KI387_010089, partial [Taxus chinensis]
MNRASVFIDVVGNLKELLQPVNEVQNELMDLLSISVHRRYQYHEEVEELIYLNKKYFPLETRSFNVLLNVWGNILDVYHVKRLWNDMHNLCITLDVCSYTTIICCFSKESKFYDINRYDEMMKKGFTPNLK